MITLDEGGWRHAEVQLLAPSAGLEGIVELFWFDDWSRRRTRGGGYRIVADDAPHILWHSYDERLNVPDSVTVVGARSTYLDVDVSVRRATIGVRLCPGVLPSLVGRPAQSFTDRSIDLHRVVRPVLGRTIRRLHMASSVAPVRELECVIAAMADEGPAVDERVRWVAQLDRTNPPRAADVARMLGMAERTARVWSVAHLGLGLRRFMGIRRLHAALEMRLLRERATWSEVAATTGYADQAHLIRDCRTLLGETPVAFAARSG